MLRATLLLSLMAFVLPGCVVWEIRDEMRGVNTRLDQVESTLATVNQGLGSVQNELTDIEVQLGDVRTTIDNTNHYLDDVYGGLGDTNSSLGDMQERLQLLRSVQNSLSSIDVHLASLRKTINRIDGAIPFLSLGGDEVVETAQPVEPSTPTASETGDEVASTTSGADENAPASPAPQPAARRPDPLVGVWISAQPDDGMTLVIQPSNEYVLTHPVEGAPDHREQGEWKRTGAALTLVPSRSAASRASSRQFTIVLQTTRSLTVDNGEQIRVFVKP